jgi:septal ring factor EnvC (AmiA/AmiB activator)
LALFFYTPALSQESNTDTRQQLEKDLQAIETQIKELEKQITVTKGEKQTLASKIKQLKNEGDKLRLEIKATNVKINDLEN